MDRDLPEGPWLSRQKGLQAKLTAADAVELAEIVAEGAQCERLRMAAGKKEPLPPGERSFFLSARKLLVAEIAVARGLEEVTAEQWVDEQLARPGR
jgi:RNA polymerase-interacting CarD/CdnL/TRCF family regulator